MRGAGFRIQGSDLAVPPHCRVSASRPASDTAPQPSALSPRPSLRGMSLIEMLVVMMILVIGIFSIANVFPQGFKFIEHSRNVTLASRLCQAEVERWKAYAANVPDGIVAENGAGLVWTDYDPNDMSNADPTKMPNDDILWNWSNVNRVRLIRGEVTLIPTATMLPYGTGGNYAFSLYNLKCAPVVFRTHANSGGVLPPGFEWPDQFALIYGDPQTRLDVTGLSGDALTNALDGLTRGNYAIDYDKGTLYFEVPPFDQKFKVEYSFWANGVLQTATQVVTVSSNGNGQVQLQPGIDTYSERVSRKFDYVDPGQFDNRNPYQFTLLNGYAATSFCPTIAFNPIGQNRTVRTNLGTRPLTAHIDYAVVDWHVIHEDRTVPNPPNPDPNGYTIRLTLPGLKVAGRNYPDVNAVGNDFGKVAMAPYVGLTPDVPGFSLVGLDMTDDTLMLDEPGGLVVDYTNGIVHVPAGLKKYTPFKGTLTGQDIRGHDVRFFYQAVGDWAVQVSKAWASYQRNDVGAAALSNLQFNEFDAELVKPGDTVSQIGYTNDTNEVVSVLIFPRCYAGLAISVSLVWYDKNSVPHEITGHQDKLSERTGYPYLVVPLAKPDVFSFPANANEAWKNPYFTFVQGASLKVRTIWREDPRHWDSRDMETFLNRK